MGADMYVSGLVIKMTPSEKKLWFNNKEFLFEKRLIKLDKVIDVLKDDYLEDSEWDGVREYYDNGNGKLTFKEYLKQAIKDAVNSLKSRELAYWRVQSCLLMITGGMANGDSPTECFDTFCRINVFPLDILELGGFQ